jgi:type 1 fimbria pilin
MKLFLSPLSHHVIRSHSLWSRFLSLAIGFMAMTTWGIAADDSVTPQFIGDVTAGQPVTMTITITQGTVKEIKLPQVRGLTLNGSGKDRSEYTFFLTPAKAGDYTIPAFDVVTENGKTIHVNSVKLHVGS